MGCVKRSVGCERKRVGRESGVKREREGERVGCEREGECGFERVGWESVLGMREWVV